MLYRNFRWRSAYSGFSLIELLLALAISVTALLGFAQLQQKNLSSERELMRSLQARLLIDEISSVLRGSPNPEYYLTGGGHRTSASNCLLKACSPREFADYRVALWACRLDAKPALCDRLGITKSLFPDGKLIITRSGKQILIQLKWQTISATERAISYRLVP